MVKFFNNILFLLFKHISQRYFFLFFSRSFLFIEYFNGKALVVERIGGVVVQFIHHFLLQRYSSRGYIDEFSLGSPLLNIFFDLNICNCSLQWTLIDSEAFILLPPLRFISHRNIHLSCFSFWRLNLLDCCLFLAFLGCTLYSVLHTL